LEVAKVAERLDGSNDFLRILSMRGCEQWAAFTNERKVTNLAECMGTSCDVVAPGGQAAGQAMLGGRRSWTGDQDEVIELSAVDSAAVVGEAKLSTNLVWRFHALRVSWDPSMTVPGEPHTPEALITRALWCDVCPSGTSPCGKSWPACIGDVCAEGL